MDELAYIVAGIATIGWIVLFIYNSKHPTPKKD